MLTDTDFISGTLLYYCSRKTEFQFVGLCLKDKIYWVQLSNNCFVQILDKKNFTLLNSAMECTEILFTPKKKL